MNSFVDLLENAYPVEVEVTDRPIGPLLDAIQRRADCQDGLQVEGIWRLHRREAQELEGALGQSPPGGWLGLTSLAVGTGILRAREDSFITGPEESPLWLKEEEECRRRLVEAFTRWLIPPSVAAALFLGLGIHPLWGLRLARRLHHDAPMMDCFSMPWRDEELMPEAALSELRKGIFAGLSVILSGLRSLHSHRRYSAEGLRHFLLEALEYGFLQIEDDFEGLSLLIGDPEQMGLSRTRGLEIAATEIIEGVFLPAGILRSQPEGGFSLRPELLETVQVGHLGRDAQQTWFQCYLVGEARTGLFTSTVRSMGAQ